MWHKACGSDRWRQDLDDIETQIRATSDEDLWKMRCANREHLVDTVRNRNTRQESSIGTWSASGRGDAEQLYSILEKEVVPLFYRREPSGIPSEWVATMRESMARLTGQYSATHCDLLDMMPKGEFRACL